MMYTIDILTQFVSLFLGLFMIYMIAYLWIKMAKPIFDRFNIVEKLKESLTLDEVKKICDEQNINFKEITKDYGRLFCKSDKTANRIQKRLEAIEDLNLDVLKE